jgi:hypothetical protein
MRSFNAKCDIDRPTLSGSQNDIGEANFTTATSVSTNTPCFLERGERAILYDVGQARQQKSDIGSAQYFSLYVGASIDILVNDVVTVETIEYVVRDVFTVKKLGRKVSHKEIRMEKL